MDVFITDLAYADDVVLLADSNEEMQRMVNAEEKRAKAVGLHINTSKTKILSALLPDNQAPTVTLGGEPIEREDRFMYLESIFGATGQNA